MRPVLPIKTERPEITRLTNPFTHGRLTPAPSPAGKGLLVLSVWLLWGRGHDEATRCHSRHPSSEVSRAGQFAGAEATLRAGAGGCCSCSIIIWSWMVFSSPLLREKKEEVPPHGIFSLLEGPFLVVLASHHSRSSAWETAASTHHLHIGFSLEKKR